MHTVHCTLWVNCTAQTLGNDPGAHCTYAVAVNNEPNTVPEFVSTSLVNLESAYTVSAPFPHPREITLKRDRADLPQGWNNSLLTLTECNYFLRRTEIPGLLRPSPCLFHSYRIHTCTVRYFGCGYTKEEGPCVSNFATYCVDIVPRFFTVVDFLFLGI